MDKPIDVIDQTALDIGRSADILLYTIEGLFERFIRTSPNLQGLHSFNAAADAVLANTMEIVLGKLSQGALSLEQSLSAPERDLFRQHDARDELHGDAQNAFWGAFQQIRIAYVKRMREMITVKALSAGIPNAQVMNRAARRWNLSDFAYLTGRRLLMDRYNEAKIGNMVNNGYTRFIMDTENKDLINLDFAISEYPDIAKEYFHPRATNLVGEPYVST